jgi:flagellar protein FlaG
MSTITQLTTVPADLIGAQALRPQKPIEPERKPAKTIGKPAADADQRLVVREGTEDGLFVYTILDRASGQVMMQIPREDLAQLAARPDYEAGQVIDTKV